MYWRNSVQIVKSPVGSSKGGGSWNRYATGQHTQYLESKWKRKQSVKCATFICISQEIICIGDEILSLQKLYMCLCKRVELSCEFFFTVLVYSLMAALRKSKHVAVMYK